MTRAEILKRIGELEDALFYLEMADHWEPDDYRFSWEKKQEIRELRAMLETA